MTPSAWSANSRLGIQRDAGAKALAHFKDEGSPDPAPLSDDLAPPFIVAIDMGRVEQD